MLRRSNSLLIIAVLLTFVSIEAASLFAQPAPRARQRLEQFKKLKLIETLDLEDIVAEKFFVAYNRSSRQIEASKQALDSAMTDLYKAVESGADESVITQKTETALDKHAQAMDAVKSMMTSVRAVLTPEQYARYIIFEARFHKEVKRRLSEMGDRGRDRRERRDGRDR